MDDPAHRLSYWLTDLHPAHYSPKNDVKAVLREVVLLRRKVTVLENKERVQRSHPTKERQ